MLRVDSNPRKINLIKEPGSGSDCALAVSKVDGSDASLLESAAHRGSAESEKFDSRGSERGLKSGEHKWQSLRVCSTRMVMFTGSMPWIRSGSTARCCIRPWVLTSVRCATLNGRW